MSDRPMHINHSRRTPLPRKLLNVGARLTAAAGFTAAGLTSPAGLISAAEAATTPGNLRGVSSQDAGSTFTIASLETTETTETQLEYWKRLTEWLQVDVQKVQIDGMMKDSVVINLKPEGAKALAQMDQDNPKNLTTMDFALFAALQREAAEGSLPTDPAAYTEHLAGTYDLLSISDDVARRYAVEPKAAGVVNTYFVEQEGGVFALNVKGANVLSTLESGDLKIAIPQETLNSVKKDATANPAENIPAVQHPAAVSAQEGVAAAPDAIPPPVKLEATPVPLTPDQEKAKKLIPWLVGLGGAGLSLLGLGWLVSRGPQKTNQPNLLGGARSNRFKGGISNASLKAIDEEQKDIRSGKYG